MTDPYSSVPPSVPPPLPGQGLRPSRPWTVTAAAGFMLFLVLMSLGILFFGLANTDVTRTAIRRSIEDAGQAADEGAVDTALAISVAIGIGYTLIHVVAFVILAVFVLRGSNPARIVTWVFCGIFFLCGGLSLVSTLAAQAEYLPRGYLTLTIVASVVSALLYLAIILLLALPASNAYFKPRR